MRNDEPTEDEFWEQFAKDAPRLEQELLAEFGPPERVVEQETARMHQEAQESLTGMPEEQSEWEADGYPGWESEPTGSGSMADIEKEWAEHGPQGEPGPGPHQDEPMRPYPARNCDWM